MFVDSHCHLDRLNYPELHQNIEAVIAKAKAAKVEQLLSVGVTLADFPAMYQKIEPFAGVYASCGVHPLDCESGFDRQQLLEFAAYDKVVAIGETGLDYNYAPQTKALQQELFIEQVEVAKAVNKPLIIHTRQAREDTLAILRAHQAEQVGGVIHCFTEDLAFAEQAMALGFYISISGIVTFNQAAELKAVVQRLPLERLLIETDSPYLAPAPYRGKENQPAYVARVAEYIALLKAESVETIAEVTTKNFETLFLRRQ
ncbi:putative metal-dependent hydrolase YcfH [Vibrio stylophorae]|uniref:Metal-dependent hydrolase YcfH n=1 Tax=Vibrio stylophorae TaxID=659351 RepID=A0ABM8ZRW0_9VIBR|nr:YchF/TatD family DNA exonuclease [Vibrio stylophorae]CAH0533038.1 putative metal-dependent hydrolase YcfH [Vibrio stylophorae]